MLSRPPAKPHDALERALAALEHLTPPPSDPFAAPILRARRRLGFATDPEPLLAWWRTRDLGTPASTMRYRWDVSHKRCAPPDWAGPVDTWRAWRPLEQPQLEREPFRFEERLTIPILVADTCDLLVELSEGQDDVARETATLLAEAEPVFRRDLSFYLQGGDPWLDTFALFCLVRAPRALERMHPFALAIAASHSASVQRSAGALLRGARFPFHDVPLVSASAQLAAGLVALGVDLPLVGRLVDEVRATPGESGGWGDGLGPEDPMTTLVAADLLAHLDPSFDTSGAAAWFARKQSSAGWWRALGPDTPWFTAQVAMWLQATERPFAERFRWPHLAAQHRDHKTGLPSFAYFIDLARLFTDLPGLASAHAEVAFVDLAGFGAFNNAHGQDAGDAVLAAFASDLACLGASRAIRDGGDEFLVVGAPGWTHLAAELDRFRRAWPERFRARFGGGAPVAPRILVATADGRRLRRAREVLGRMVGEVKAREKTPPPEGVLAELGELGE
jgi:GGDEF domain-containing protein